jgi:hypothetical protein
LYLLSEQKESPNNHMVPAFRRLFKQRQKKRAETSGKYLCSVVGEKEKKKIHIQ